MLTLTFCAEAVHHGLYDVQLVLDGEVDEVCVHKDQVRRSQLVVVLEKQAGCHLWSVRERERERERVK